MKLRIEKEVVRYFNLDGKTYKAVFKRHDFSDCDNCAIGEKQCSNLIERGYYLDINRDIGINPRVISTLPCRTVGYRDICTSFKEISDSETKHKHAWVEKSKTLSPKDIVDMFCDKFCPLKEKDYVCKDSLACPFKEVLGDSISVFKLDFEHDK